MVAKKDYRLKLGDLKTESFILNLAENEVFTVAGGFNFFGNNGTITWCPPQHTTGVNGGGAMGKGKKKRHESESKKVALAFAPGVIAPWYLPERDMTDLYEVDPPDFLVEDEDEDFRPTC